MPPRPPRLDAQLVLRARRALRRRDPRLGALVGRVGPCRLRPSGDPYRSLLRSVLFQQLAGAAARAIDARLRGHFGGRYPPPEALLRARPEELRRVGLSRQKVAALRDIAEAFASRRVRSRRLYWMGDEEVIDAVTSIRGVGVWTAHMLLVFSLGRPDVLPVGDYGIRKGVETLYELDALPGVCEIEALAEPWRPYRSIASWYLWRV